MNIGISTACLYPMETEKALETVGKLGVSAVEIFINAPSELRTDFLKNLKAICDFYAMNIIAIHPYSSGFEPFMFFTNYERRFQDAMTMYEDYYRAANLLGAKIVVLHGDRKEGLLPDEMYYDRFGEMFLHAKRHDVILAQENVERCRSRSSAFVWHMYEYLKDDVRFVLDLKQAIRSGEDIFAMYKAMAKGLVHVHLSDHNSKEDCLAPGSGIFNFAEFEKYLKADCYKGSGVIELYRSNYKSAADLYKSYCWLKAIQ